MYLQYINVGNWRNIFRIFKLKYTELYEVHTFRIL